ncbi:MAG TPA: acyl carrier protein [Blastocatellia bacterium]|nr:acyl carrier protein [Blastocatellia bacterium]
MQANESLSVTREVVYELVGKQIADDQPIISSGMIDSLSILKLISMLEEKLGINIPTAEVQPDDFDTIELTTETIERVTT